MIALPGTTVVKSGGNLLTEVGRRKLVAGFTRGRFELIQLGVTLSGDLAIGCLAIKVGTGAVVKSGVNVDPALHIRIACIFRGLGSLRQPQTDQELVERRKICIRGRLFALIRACGYGSPTPRGAD